MQFVEWRELVHVLPSLGEHVEQVLYVHVLHHFARLGQLGLSARDGALEQDAEAARLLLGRIVTALRGVVEARHCFGERHVAQRDVVLRAMHRLLVLLDDERAARRDEYLGFVGKGREVVGVRREAVGEAMDLVDADAPADGARHVALARHRGERVPPLDRADRRRSEDARHASVVHLRRDQKKIRMYQKKSEDQKEFGTPP